MKSFSGAASPTVTSEASAGSSLRLISRVSLRLGGAYSVPDAPPRSKAPFGGLALRLGELSAPAPPASDEPACPGPEPPSAPGRPRPDACLFGWLLRNGAKNGFARTGGTQRRVS